MKKILKSLIIFNIVLSFLLVDGLLNNSLNSKDYTNNQYLVLNSEDYINDIQQLKIDISYNNVDPIIYNDTNTNNKGGRIQMYEDTFGTKLDGYEYDVVLPDGVPTVVVPNVVGMTLVEALQWSIDNLNRNITIFETGCYGAEFTAGTVVKQSPIAGSLIPNDYDQITTSSLTTGLTVWVESDGCIY